MAFNRTDPEYLYDRRLMQRHIDMGVIKAEEAKDFVESLADAEGHSDRFTVEMVSLGAKVGEREVHETPGDETTVM